MANSKDCSFLSPPRILTLGGFVSFVLLCVAFSYHAALLSAEDFYLTLNEQGQSVITDSSGNTYDSLGEQLKNTANNVYVQGGTLKVDGSYDLKSNFIYDDSSVLTVDINNASMLATGSNGHVTPMTQTLLSSDNRNIYFINSEKTSAFLELGTQYEMSYGSYTGSYVAKDGAIIRITDAHHDLDVNLRMESGSTLVIPYKAKPAYAYRTSSKSIALNNATLQYGSYGNLIANGFSFSGDCTVQSIGTDWYRIKSSNSNDGSSFTGSGTITLIGPGYLAINSDYKATKYTGDFIIGTNSTTGKLSLEGDNVINANTTIKSINGTVDWGAKSQSFKALEYQSGTMDKMTGTLTIGSEFKYDSSTNLTVPGVIAGSAKLTKEGSGTLTLSVKNSYSGGTSIKSGTLSLGHSEAVGSGTLTLDNATLSSKQGTISASSVTITGDSTFISSSGWNLFKGFSGSGTLTLTGSGYLAFKTNNPATNYTGVIIVGTSSTAGALQLESNNVLNADNGVIKVVKGRVRWGDKDQSFDQSFNSFEYLDGTMEYWTGTLTLGSEFKYNSSTDLDVPAVIAGSAKLTKVGSGTLSLSGANTYSGGTTISSGTLALTGSAGSLGSGDVTVAENATLEIAYDDSSATVTLPNITMAKGSLIKVTSGQVAFTDDVTLNNLYNLPGESGTVNVDGALTLNNDKKTKYSGEISAQSITKTGDGTLQLYCAAANMIDASSFIVSSGRLDMQKYFTGDLEIQSDAVFSPGNSVGPLYETGNFTLDAGATLLLEIGTQDGETVGDLLQVEGTATFASGSFVEIGLDETSQLKGGDDFSLVMITADSFGEGFNIDNFNNLLRSYYFTDLEATFANNQITISGRLDPNAVPEPSTWALLLLGAAGLLYVRKRKN